ncbi:hypothetical protein IID23_00890 [Patescibacteria group bacterium]|nr:hypothetical protein [Patescibacteria group bacterium]
METLFSWVVSPVIMTFMLFLVLLSRRETKKFDQSIKLEREVIRTKMIELAMFVELSQYIHRNPLLQVLTEVEREENGAVGRVKVLAGTRTFEFSADPIPGLVDYFLIMIGRSRVN